MQCSRCGADLPEGTAICPHCGQALAAPPPATAATAAPPPYGAATATPEPAARPQYRSVSEQIDDWQNKLPAPFTGVALEVLAACALIVGSALWLGIRSAFNIDDAIRYMTDWNESGIGLFLLGWMLFLIGFAVWLIYLAWRLVQGNTVTRHVAFVPLIGYGLAVLFAEATGVALFLTTMLLLWVAAAALLVLPGARRHFGAAKGATPSPVAVAVDVLRAFVAGVAFMGVIYVVSWILMKANDGDPDLKAVVIGALFIVAAAGIFLLLPRLSGGDPMAQLVVSVLVAAYLILMAILDGKLIVLLIALFLGVGACVYLWLPPSARAHFGVGQRRPATAPVPPPPPAA